jgi:peptide/histidine transporter 3/4
MVLTITRRDAMILGSGKATVTLLMGTQINIKEVLLYPDSTCTLLSYRDIRKNGIHVETHEENKEEFLLSIKDIGQGKETLEKVPSLPSGLYYT